MLSELLQSPPGLKIGFIAVLLPLLAQEMDMHPSPTRVKESCLLNHVLMEEMSSKGMLQDNKRLLLHVAFLYYLPVIRWCANIIWIDLLEILLSVTKRHFGTVQHAFPLSSVQDYKYTTCTQSVCILIPCFPDQSLIAFQAVESPLIPGFY